MMKTSVIQKANRYQESINPYILVKVLLKRFILINSGKDHPPALTKREQIPRASDIGPFYRFVRMNRGGKGDIPFIT